MPSSLPLEEVAGLAVLEALVDPARLGELLVRAVLHDLALLQDHDALLEDGVFDCLRGVNIRKRYRMFLALLERGYTDAAATYWYSHVSSGGAATLAGRKLRRK